MDKTFSNENKLCGILTRRERWGLSRRGWLVIVLVVLLIAFSIIFGIHPFLAPTHRVNANDVVVEGWVNEYTVRRAIDEFRTGSYQRIFTTGGPITGSGGNTTVNNTYAEFGADRLKAAGAPVELVQAVPARTVNHDRTYSSAVALREWFKEHHIKVRAINVLTEDVHARRTWLLFQEAFGKSVQVGIIAVPNPDYDPRHWWRYSEGVREILGEGIAYVYAKFFFWPGDAPAAEMSEVRGQRSAVSGQKAAVSNQRSAVRSQQSAVRGQ